MKQGSARESLQQLTVDFRAAFPGALRGAYVIGSLAHGGFSEKFSDVDVGFIFSRTPDPEAVSAASESARQRDPELGEKLSVFWSDEGFRGGRFPVPDRIDLVDNRRPLWEDRAYSPARPTQEELRSSIRQNSLPYWEKMGSHFTRKQARFDGFAEEKELLRCLLYPARLVFSWETGRIAGNDEAVRYLRANPPATIDVALLERALLLRNGALGWEDIGPFSLAEQRARTLAHLGIPHAS